MAIMHRPKRGVLLTIAGGIAAMASFLLFGLQPLTVDRMNGWHSPATVVQFFQWTYLLGVLLTAASVNLSAKADLRLAAALFVPAAVYTFGTAMPDGPRRLGDVGPIAVWLASASTVMIRSLAGVLSSSDLRPYSIVAASNAGALFGVLLWLQPARPTTEVSWMAVAPALLLIGLGLTLLLRIFAKLPTPEVRVRAPGPHRPSYRKHCEPLWFVLAMSASLTLMVAYRQLASGEFHAQDEAQSMSATAMPLLVFLLAYVIVWSPRSDLSSKPRIPLHLHALAIIVVMDGAATVNPVMMFVLLTQYVVCAACVEGLRRLAPAPAFATRFQVVQAIGGACGGWLALAL